MRFLTGIKPSGFPHLGNYFGAIKPAICLQEEGEAFYFIADYHALTTVRDPELLRHYTNEVALSWLACGLDPNRAVFYRQSDVPEVHELAWILSVLTPKGLLERCTSYKDAVAKGIAASQGLFAYPVLMAADILLCQADVVPVGCDQKQHVEITRDLAKKFNEVYRPVFQIPEPRIQEQGSRISGLDGQKMSKSYNNILRLFADPKEWKKQVMSIPTDSTPIEAPKSVDDSILIDFFSLVASEQEQREYRLQFEKGGTGYGDLKKELLQKLLDYFESQRQKYHEYEAHPDELADILKAGARRARVVAQSTIHAVREATGFGASFIH